MQTSPHKLVVITGLSGSGKSIALNALEDIGYNCIDNLPVSLFAALVEELIKHPKGMNANMAVGIDARVPSMELNRVPGLLKKLQTQGLAGDIVFLDADDQVLIQRFSETRRRHPLTNEQNDLAAAIAQERILLTVLKEKAELCIDTSRTSVHELREMVRDRVALRKAGELSLMLQSFGFKHGAPRNADFMFDVRCLPNPHWQAELRPLTGKDQKVIDFLQDDPQVKTMLQQLHDFIVYWLPGFAQGGRSYLTFAVGCTGGQHRSVYLVETLAKMLEGQVPQILVMHRELT
jgi:UPF0042 nucleotide-binding protein